MQPRSCGRIARRTARARTIETRRRPGDVDPDAQGQLSPDGRWLAYCSDESGTWEVLVRGMSTGSTLQVSTDGGSQPWWRGDGNELFYVARDGTLVAVPLRQVGPSLAIAGRPQRLFETRTPPMLAPFRMGFAVIADGQRFVVTTVAPDTPPQVIMIIENLTR